MKTYLLNHEGTTLIDMLENFQNQAHDLEILEDIERIEFKDEANPKYMIAQDLQELFPRRGAKRKFGAEKPVTETLYSEMGLLTLWDNMLPYMAVFEIPDYSIVREWIGKEYTDHHIHKLLMLLAEQDIDDKWLVIADYDSREAFDKNLTDRIELLSGKVNDVNPLTDYPKRRMWDILWGCIMAHHCNKAKIF